MQAVTLTMALAALSFACEAQFRIAPPERKTPRAVAVLETFKNGSRRLIPVTFLFEKKYYDATFYHATPVPFTLYSETVYEVEQFGKPLGTFTVQSATRNSAEWFGNGKFKALPDASLMAKKKAARVVVEDPSKPTLHRREGSEGDIPAAHPSATAASAPEVDEDPDRPKLHRRDDASGPGTPGSGTPGSTSTQTASTTATPTASAKPAAGAAAAGLGQAELTPSDDPDHPILRRGKPVQEQGGRDLPDFKKEEPVSRQVAVSDSGRALEAPPLIYVCGEEERTQLETQARAMAQAELRRLGGQRGLALPEAKAAAGKTTSAGKLKAAKKTEAAAPAELKFGEEQFIPYDLDYNNYATVVYSARYTPEAAAAAVVGKPKSWVVTVIAKEDEGKLVKLYSAVSDPRELGLYPEIRLVDAVDPDGYGHYGLLFREQKRDGVSWLLGRATGYELQTVFETAAR